MERGRFRRNSISSVHSQGNSSCANIQCSDLHTHAIVQKEKDNKVIMVPLDSFINFGKTIKVNEVATFKTNKDSRKADRGKVLLFGTEELCVDQLQVLEEDFIDENKPPEKKPSKKISSLTSSNNDKHEQINNRLQKKNKQNHVMKESTTAKGYSQMNENDDRFSTSSPMKFNTASSITIQPLTRNENRKPQVNRKLFPNSTQMVSTNDFVFEENDIDELEERLTTTTKSKKIAVGESSVKQTTGFNHEVMSKQMISIDSTSQIQNESVLKPSDNHQDGSNESNTNATEANETDEPAFIPYKEYKKLHQQHVNMGKNYLALKKQIDFMKKNYVPMPDIKARPWFVRVAKMFGEQLSATDICAHSQRIGINNPNNLLTCIRDRGTDTARQIIRALYTKEQLESESGTTAVSKQRRQAISDFVQLQNGTIPDHQFNEAVNGVFRQAKTDMRKEQKKTMQKPVEKNKCNDGQQLIDNMLFSKKSTANVAKKVTKICNNPMSDSDDDDDNHF